MVDDEESGTGRAGGAGAATEYEFPGDDLRGQGVRAEGLEVTRSGPLGARTPRRRRRVVPQPVRDVDGRSAARSRTSSPSPGAARSSLGRIERGAEGTTRWRSSAFTRRRPGRPHRHRDVPQTPRRGPAGGVGLRCAGSSCEDVERGQVVISPDRSPRTRVRGPRLHPVQGRGRPAHAFFQQHRPQFYFRTTDVTGWW